MAFEQFEDRRLAKSFAGHVLLLLLALAGLGWTLVTPGLAITRMLALVVSALALWLLWRFLQHSHQEVRRFIEAVRLDDMQLRFSPAGERTHPLRSALDDALAALRRSRARDGEIARFNASLIDDVPVALLTVGREGQVALINKAARKLFCGHQGAHLRDFDRYGVQFRFAIVDLKPGESRTVMLSLETGTQRAIVRSSSLAHSSGLTRVIAIQVIQQALNAAELAAQSDLVRVLTHEIMNSITPITSLAGTAARMMAQLDDRNGLLVDARNAVETLARRADGIMHFVETYRETTRPPQVRRTRFAAETFVTDLRRLFEAENRWPNVRIDVSMVPSKQMIEADRDLLMQVLLNLLRNAAEAASDFSEEPAVSVSITSLRSGRTKVRVSDNGPGIPAAIRDDVFLPFLTTRRHGTGIGLSLARQIILAHDGSIEARGDPDSGASFEIVI